MFFRKRAYKVKLRGCSGIEYSEGKKKILIGSEFMAGKEIVVYSNSVTTWQAPYDKEEITDQKKKEIQHKITEDLKKHGIPVEWV